MVPINVEIDRHFATYVWQNCPYKSSVLYRGRNPTLYHSFPNKENQETMVVVMSNGSACNLCFVSNTSLSDILSFNTFWQTVGSWRTKIDKILNCLLEVIDGRASQEHCCTTRYSKPRLVVLTDLLWSICDWARKNYRVISNVLKKKKKKKKNPRDSAFWIDEFISPGADNGKNDLRYSVANLLYFIFWAENKLSLKNHHWIKEKTVLPEILVLGKTLDSQHASYRSM